MSNDRYSGPLIYHPPLSEQQSARLADVYRVIGNSCVRSLWQSAELPEDVGHGSVMKEFRRRYAIAHGPDSESHRRFVDLHGHVPEEVASGG